MSSGVRTILQIIQISIFSGIGILCFMLLSKSIEWPVLYEIATEHRMLGAVLFACLMFVTTVVAPLSSLGMVPMIAPLIGPFTTGVACYVGWLLGAVVAFHIGRVYGQPCITKMMSQKTLNHYTRYLQKDMSFMYIIMLRMILPVDILSYMLGVFTTVSFAKYTVASAIGILWFSFAFAYLGDAFVQGDYVLIAEVGVASVAILVGAWLYIHYRIKKPT
jgi:uncharacterized membrane protein YdjX (TVP38/TMEM64 family)